MNHSVTVQVSAKVVDTHRQFVAAAEAARAAGPDEEEKASARRLFGTTYHVFEIECRRAGLELAEPSRAMVSY